MQGGRFCRTAHDRQVAQELVSQEFRVGETSNAPFGTPSRDHGTDQN